MAATTRATSAGILAIVALFAMFGMFNANSEGYFAYSQQGALYNQVTTTEWYPRVTVVPQPTILPTHKPTFCRVDNECPRGGVCKNTKVLTPGWTGDQLSYVKLCVPE